MEELPSIKKEGETNKKLNLIKIQLEINKNNYELNIDSKEEIITFELFNKDQIPCVNYIRTMNFKEIKELNQLFSLLKTYNDFYDYLKLLSKDKKINIKKSQDKMTIILFVDVLSRQREIKIDLFPEKNVKIKENTEKENTKKMNTENQRENDGLRLQNKQLNKKLENVYEEKSNIFTKCFNYLFLFMILIIFSYMAIFIIKSKYLKIYSDLLEKQNKELTEKLEKQIKELNDRNEIHIKQLNQKIQKQNIVINNLKDLIILFDDTGKRFSYFNQSIIIKRNENSFIFKEIENKMNKRIKEIRKLYQATIDGGEPINFHKRCNNIPNTLVLIQSEENKRFGGFTPIPWASDNLGKKDIKNTTFVFSLDDKKIYYLKNTNSTAVYHHEKYGPYFGEHEDIAILGNPIKEKCLKIKGDYSALPQNPTKALEYEVFQIKFY